jgi:hypothetical protein
MFGKLHSEIVVNRQSAKQIGGLGDFGGVLVVLVK